MVFLQLKWDFSWQSAAHEFCTIFPVFQAGKATIAVNFQLHGYLALHTGDSCFSQTCFPYACSYWWACRWTHSIPSGCTGLRKLTWNPAVAEESSLGPVRWSEKHKAHMLLLLLPEKAALPASKEAAAKVICAAEAWYSQPRGGVGDCVWTV